MKSLSLNYRLGAACALVIAIGAQPLAYAYPTGAPIVPPKPKAVEVDGPASDEIGLVAYPSGAPIIPPKPKAAPPQGPQTVELAHQGLLPKQL